MRRGSPVPVIGLEAEFTLYIDTVSQNGPRSAGHGWTRMHTNGESDLTEVVIGAAFDVANVFGAGLSLSAQQQTAKVGGAVEVHNI